MQTKKQGLNYAYNKNINQSLFLLSGKDYTMHANT